MKILSLFFGTMHKPRKTVHDLVKLTSSAAIVSVTVLACLHFLFVILANPTIIALVYVSHNTILLMILAFILMFLFFNSFLAVFLKKKISFRNLLVIHFFSSGPFIAASILGSIFVIAVLASGHQWEVLSFIVVFGLLFSTIAFIFFWVWSLILHVKMLSEVAETTSIKSLGIMFLSGLLATISTGISIAFASFGF